MKINHEKGVCHIKSIFNLPLVSTHVARSFLQTTHGNIFEYNEECNKKSIKVSIFVYFIIILHESKLGSIIISCNFLHTHKKNINCLKFKILFPTIDESKITDKIYSLHAYQTNAWIAKHTYIRR